MLMLGQMVTWMVPALAWMGAAAASVPIIIHLLTRLRRRPQPWGAMRFLLEAYRKHRSRLRLEQFLLLLVRCLILAILGLALAGPALAGWSWLGGGTRGGGRIVCIVLDDSLTTRVGGFDAQQRFDRLKASALGLLGGLNAGDRVAVWRAARPVESLAVTSGGPTEDHAAVRSAIQALEPRYSTAEPGEALQAIAPVVESAAPQGLAPERVIVVVLSDWSRATLASDRETSAALAALTGKCKLFTVRPEPAAENVQIVELVPRRHMVLAESDGSASIAIEARLRRFVVDPSESETRITLTATDSAGQALGEPVTREHHWLPGQTEAMVQAELGLRRDVVELQVGATVLVTLSGRIEGARTGDALSQDDQRWSLVELRRKLRVAVVDVASIAAASTEENTLSPGQWLSLALTPSDALEDERIELAPMEPQRVEAEALSGMDAAMVLRPDLLGAAGWSELKRLAESGGVVWLFAPASAAPAVWAEPMRTALGVDWQLGLEAQEFEASDEASADAGWALAVDQPAPELLGLLAADWGDLLRPVRVMRRLPLTAPSGGTWLAAVDGQPLLAAASVGSGRVLLLATALDPAWSNLPTKPLFVPLVHESLRSALGASSAVASLSSATVGEPLNLRGSWEGVEALQKDTVTIALRRGEGGTMSGEAVEEPGVYRAANDAARRVVVNLDAAAGDTGALDGDAVARWFAPLGGVEWLNAEEPAAILRQQVNRAALGWPLLWVVLAFVLLEAFLARWFSHARNEAWVPWRFRIARWIRG